eukprot:1147947-Prorocentrum_minimum.AAC.1
MTGNGANMFGMAPEDMPALEGCVLLMKAATGTWAAHCAMVAVAPTLVWLAADAGARAVVFVWPVSAPQQNTFYCTGTNWKIVSTYEPRTMRAVKVSSKSSHSSRRWQ